MKTTLIILWTPRHPDAQVVDVIAETAKALRIRNRDTGRIAWIPRAGLRPHIPGQLWGVADRPADPAERVVADWFRAKCSSSQMAALGFSE